MPGGSKRSLSAPRFDEVLVAGAHWVAVATLPLAWIFLAPRRLSSVSSTPRTSGPSATNASISSPKSTRLVSRLDHRVRG